MLMDFHGGLLMNEFIERRYLNGTGNSDIT